MRELGLGSDSTVVDLGAGTGKLTRALVPLVGRVVAVEPLAEMRRELEATVAGVEVVEGTANEIPLGDGSADAVFVAEAFHWFATPEAVAEIARVVRPGGGIVLMWNRHEFPAEQWVTEMGELIAARRAPGIKPENRYGSGLWREAFADSPFEPLSHAEVRHEQPTDIDGLVAHISTWSFVAALPDEERAALMEDVAASVRRGLEDADRVAIRYRTQVYWARRR